MELRISARNLTVSERFREYATERAAKIEQLAQRSEEVHIKVTRHDHSRGATEDQVELTVYEPRHVLRAEARAEDKFAAFDLAFGKLLERLRRHNDRQNDHRSNGTSHRNMGLSELAADDFAAIDLKPVDYQVLTGESATSEVEAEAAALADAKAAALGESPVIIRRKEFTAEPMSAEEALDRMELVGHDFYLFRDAESGKPGVVYRRKGWSYGVITLDS
jgi:ribosomal subunit interface protein